MFIRSVASDMKTIYLTAPLELGPWGPRVSDPGLESFIEDALYYSFFLLFFFELLVCLLLLLGFRCFWIVWTFGRYVQTFPDPLIATGSCHPKLTA